ncbi:MAG: hypothetical protein JRJ29_23030 [Deltaproteobacteria bacterium]|nr:hypothetical protein [Deltaproteobacteria bacterium]
MKGKETKTEKDEGLLSCPVAYLFADLKALLGPKSGFFKHLNQSRVEFLKALRALLDERIQSLEERPSGRPARQRTKVKVE